MSDDSKSSVAAAHGARVPQKARAQVETQQSVIVDAVSPLTSAQNDAGSQALGDSSHVENEVTSVSRMTRGSVGRRALWLLGSVESNRTASLVLAVATLVVLSALLLLKYR